MKNPNSPKNKMERQKQVQKAYEANSGKISKHPIHKKKNQAVGQALYDGGVVQTSVKGSQQDAFNKKLNKRATQDSKKFKQVSSLESLEVMTPASFGYNFTDNYNGAVKIAQAVVSKLASQRPLIFAGTASATNPSPVSVVGYLVWALYTMWRKDGVFKNSGIYGGYADFPSDWKIPNAFLECLKYNRPYRRSGVTLEFTDSTTTALPAYPTTNNTVSAGNNSFGAAPWNVAPFAMTDGTKMEMSYSSGAVGSWSDVTGAGFGDGISAILASEFACGCLDDLAPLAPDASAYAIRGSSNVYTCAVPQFDEEVALLLQNQGTTNGNVGAVNTFVKPTPVAAYFYSELQAYWLEIYSRIPFHPTYTKQRSLGMYPIPRVHYIIGFDQKITTASFMYVICLTYLEMNGGPITTSLQYQQFASFVIVCMSALIAKIVRLNPTWAYDVGPITSDEFLEVSLPVPIAKFINEIGIVQKGNRIVLPVINALGTSTANWCNLATPPAGASAFGTSNAWAIPLQSGTSATWPSLLWQIGAQNLSGGFATATTFTLTPLASANLFIEIYRGFLVSSGMSGLMIEVDPMKFIGGLLMYTGADTTNVPGTTGANPFPFPILASGGTTLVIQLRPPGVTCLVSSKPLTEVSLALLTIFAPFTAQINSNDTGVTALAAPWPYKVVLANANVVTASSVTALIANTLSADTQQLIANKRTSNKQDMKMWRGQLVDVSKDGGFLTEIVDSIMAPILGDVLSAGNKLLKPVAQAMDEFDSSFAQAIPTKSMAKLGLSGKDLITIGKTMALL